MAARRAFRDVGASLAITYLNDKASPLGDDPLGYRSATVGGIGPPSLAAWASDPLREDRSPTGGPADSWQRFDKFVNKGFLGHTLSNDRTDLFEPEVSSGPRVNILTGEDCRPIFFV